MRDDQVSCSGALNYAAPINDRPPPRLVRRFLVEDSGSISWLMLGVAAVSGSFLGYHG